MTINWQNKPSDYRDFDETVLNESRIFDYYKWKSAKKTQKKTAKQGKSPCALAFFDADKFKLTL